MSTTRSILADYFDLINQWGSYATEIWDKSAEDVTKRREGSFFLLVRSFNFCTAFLAVLAKSRRPGLMTCR